MASKMPIDNNCIILTGFLKNTKFVKIRTDFPTF